MERNGSTSGEATILLDIWLVSHLAGRLLDDALRPLGLTADEFGLYSLIHSFGPVTQTQISRWTGLAPTTVSGTLRRITTRGHLSDVPNPRDARSRLLALSQDGLAVTTRAAGILAATLPRLDDALTEGQATIRLGLSNLDNGLRHLTDAAPRPYGLQRGSQPSSQTSSQPSSHSTSQPTISYPGPRLTHPQSDEVRAFIDWLHTRDRSRSTP